MTLTKTTSVMLHEPWMFQVQVQWYEPTNDPGPSSMKESRNVWSQWKPGAPCDWRTPPVGGSQTWLDILDGPGPEGGGLRQGSSFNFQQKTLQQSSTSLSLPWLPSQCLFDKDTWHPCMCLCVAFPFYSASPSALFSSKVSNIFISRTDHLLVHYQVLLYLHFGINCSPKNPLLVLLQTVWPSKWAKYEKIFSIYSTIKKSVH